MTINQLQLALEQNKALQFALPNGKLIPEYFHITEMGLKTKHFVDCGNTIRKESVITFQIWYAKDYEHRLSVEKFKGIIQIAQPLFNNENLEIEVEYQTDLSLSLFTLSFADGIFYLNAKETTCLASDNCGIPEEKMKISLASLSPQSGCCTGTTCC